MRLNRFFPSACVLGSVLVFALQAVRADVAISTSPLTPGATTASVAAEPFVNPFGTRKPKMVSHFGMRQLPASLLSSTTQQMPAKERHEGVDYRAKPGTPVRAARSGKVIFAGFSKMYVSRADKTDQERLIIIMHADHMSSRYVHLSAIKVRPGQAVQSGQVIGILSESDEWTEPVLHFEIRDDHGRALDPAELVTEAPAEVSPTP